MEERRKTRAKRLVRSCAKSQTSLGAEWLVPRAFVWKRNGDQLSEPCREVAVGIADDVVRFPARDSQCVGRAERSVNSFRSTRWSVLATSQWHCDGIEKESVAQISGAGILGVRQAQGREVYGGPR